MVVEANSLANHRTLDSMVVPVAAVAMAVAEGFTYYQETKFSRRGEPEKWQRSYRLKQICKFSQAWWWQGLAATKCFRHYSCASQVVLVLKNLPATQETQETWVLIPGLGRFPREGNGNPLQHSCLKNTMDRGAWQATGSQSWTWLSKWTHMFTEHTVLGQKNSSTVFVTNCIIGYLSFWSMESVKYSNKGF